MVSYTHGGDIYRNQVRLDFSVNVNPLGIPQPVQQAFLDSLADLSHYPDSETEALTKAIAVFHQLPPEWILCGNGCAELIFLLAAARKPRRAVVLAPTFGEYEAALNVIGCEILSFYLKEEDNYALAVESLVNYLKTQTKTAAIDMLFLCNPNNPTGHGVKAEVLFELADSCRKMGIFLVVDECFNEFLEGYEAYSLLSRLDKDDGMLILKAFTKTYALAGLRLGYAVCSDRQTLAAMKSNRQPWSISIPAQKAGLAALSVTGFLEQTRALLKTEREYLASILEACGCLVYPSQTNYIMFRNPRENVASLGEWCKQHGLLLRCCRNFSGLSDEYYRICIRQRPENRQLAEVLKGYRSFCAG